MFDNRLLSMLNYLVVTESLDQTRLSHPQQMQLEDFQV